MKIKIYFLKSEELLAVKDFNFTGLGSATDYFVFKLSEILFRNNKQHNINIDQIYFKDCPHVSIWSLHYLNQKLSNRTLFDLHKSGISILDRIAGCDSISESLLVSLRHDHDQLMGGEVSRRYLNESKILIINEDSTKPFVIDLLLNKKPIQESLKCSSKSKPVFKYDTLNHLNNKSLNLFECSEVRLFRN